MQKALGIFARAVVLCCQKPGVPNGVYDRIGNSRLQIKNLLQVNWLNTAGNGTSLFKWMLLMYPTRLVWN